MTRTVKISEATFEKMQEVAIPLEDNADTLLSRVLDYYISQHASRGDGAVSDHDAKVPSQSDALVLNPHSPDSLTHSKIRWGKFGGRRISGRNWSQLVETAHEVLVNHVKDFEEVRRITPFNVREGRYEKRGYHFFPQAGISVQYKQVPDAWDSCLKIAEQLSLEVEIELEWLDKKSAAHPGAKARLSWAP